MGRPVKEAWAEMISKVAKDAKEMECPVCGPNDRILNVWCSLRGAQRELRNNDPGENIGLIACLVKAASEEGIASEDELTVESVRTMEFSDDANDLLDAHEAHMELTHAVNPEAFAQA